MKQYDAEKHTRLVSSKQKKNIGNRILLLRSGLLIVRKHVLRLAFRLKLSEVCLAHLTVFPGKP